MTMASGAHAVPVTMCVGARTWLAKYFISAGDGDLELATWIMTVGHRLEIARVSASLVPLLVNSIVVYLVQINFRRLLCHWNDSAKEGPD